MKKLDFLFCFRYDEEYDTNNETIFIFLNETNKNGDSNDNDISLPIIILYFMCFIIAGFGNLIVFLTLFKKKSKKSQFSFMICHLSIADLIIALFIIPIEVKYILFY